MRYKRFAKWELEYGGTATDLLNCSKPHIFICEQGDDIIDAICLTPTDIKRLAECVDRYEVFAKKGSDA